MGLMAAIVGRFDDRCNGSIGGVVFDQPIDQVDERGRFQEDESSGVEVVRQGAERFRSKPNLGAAFPLGRRVEGDCAQEVSKCGCLVDAAHAVDGDFLDEQLFFDECFVFDSRCLWFGLRFHGNPPGLT